MSGQSSVGQGSVYEAGDQRNLKNEDIKTADRFEEGVANSHKPNDSKDERSIANRLAKEEARKDSDNLTKEQKLGQEDPTLPARIHGNEPSKGAKIDAEIQAEEEEMLKKKGIK